MSYAASYALYNYSMVSPEIGPSVYDNIRLVRAFEHGLDAKSSEAGFILTHVHMVQATGPLIDGATSLLATIEDKPEDTAAAASAFQTMLDAMITIEAHMEQMWTNSLPKDYISYRTFIFGITNQSMFPQRGHLRRHTLRRLETTVLPRRIRRQRQHHPHARPHLGDSDANQPSD